MNELDLCLLPGVEALQQFRRGTLSPVEVLDAQIARAESWNPRLNAFSDCYFDEAREQARRAESAYRRGGARPLEGLTLAVKDGQDIAGKRTTHASLPFRNNIASTTAPAVQRLLDAGAIVVAKTTTPEFASAGLTYSKLFGVTGTPWNTGYTAGGSSGGAGASLAAGMTTLATGSDIAGSIRVPAACCGVVGYKPPYGRIPAVSPLNLDFYLQLGPLARSVGDCALMTNAMSGVHASDIATLREKVELPIEYGDLDKVSIAYSMDLGQFPVTATLRENLLATVSRLREAGFSVEEVEIPWGAEVTRAAIDYLDHLFGRELARSLEEYGDELCDYNVFYAERATRSTTEAYLQSLETAGRMYEDVAPILDDYHVLLCPTLATHEIPAAASPWESVTIDGYSIDCDFGWVLTHPFNMLGRLPVLAIPNGIGGNGLPTGIQVVARSYDDARVFQVAGALEKLAPWRESYRSL